ncbi:ERBB-3 BINDING PROTEIN 1-like isoform X1 [Vigna radiata var. radiata]|uniref:ERBB-3 BINDING PROTEIN 1-like isoform X1 n=1 Tax=Vigna radiata var. radiata TaxID=3916 RepID=A0A1S3VDN2_VIGRR|nr:ERBB-3 BINDING PROTEIN 1-like isoform X1 [Vigna radiata var. radiata]
MFLQIRQTGNVYKNVNRKIEKGVACATCISVNNLVCHFSPLDNDESVLEAHTHVLQEGPITGRAEDVIAAANTAAEVALRLFRPGKKVINCN